MRLTAAKLTLRLHSLNRFPALSSLKGHSQCFAAVANKVSTTSIVAFWIVARSQRALKSVKHRKLCCYCSVPKKDLALLRKSATNLPDPTHEDVLQEH